MAQQNDPGLLQVSGEELGQLGAVGDDPIECHLAAAAATVATEGLAYAAAIPLHHGEEPLPRLEDRSPTHV